MVLNDIINQAASRGTSFTSNRRRSSRKISMLLSGSNPGDEEEGPQLKERLTEAMYKGIDIFCVWDCCLPYVKAAEYISMVIFDPFTDLFITLCIVVNTLFMALDQHDMNPSMSEMLTNGNYFFTAIFGVEAAMKMMAMSPKYYFQEGWNIFDFIIVALSLFELVVATETSGLSVLRSFRLVRRVIDSRSYLSVRVLTVLTKPFFLPV